MTFKTMYDPFGQDSLDNKAQDSRFDTTMIKTVVSLYLPNEFVLGIIVLSFIIVEKLNYMRCPKQIIRYIAMLKA